MKSPGAPARLSFESDLPDPSTCSCELEAADRLTLSFYYCFAAALCACWTMTSLQHHGPHEAHKQLHCRMQRRGLSSIKVHVTRRAGKLQFHFTGSEEEVKKAEK